MTLIPLTDDAVPERRRRLEPLLYAIGVGVVIAACGDPTGTEGGIDVSIAVTAAAQPIVGTTPELTPVITCRFSLRASAVGEGQATWQAATMHFFAGVDRTTPIGDFVVQAVEVQEAWGAATIMAGTYRDSDWWVEADVPHAVRIDYDYLPSVGSSAKTASVETTCGPTIPPDPALPEITELSVQPSSSPMEPGDSFSVTYAASSRIGLWETEVVLSGPCELAERFSEGLETSVTRTVTLRLPATCALDVPVRVGVLAVDAGLQQRARSSDTQLSLVDVTPPIVQILFSRPYGGGPVNVMGGDYFVGDTIDLTAVLTDNHDLDVLVWEMLPAGVRDTIAASGDHAAVPLRIPVPAEWAGPVQLRLWARDVSGVTSDTLASAPDSLIVYPTIARPTAEATVQGEIRDFVIDVPRGVVYLLQTNQRRVAVFSTASMSVSQVVETSVGASSLDLTPGGDSLLLAIPLSRAMGVIDLRVATPVVEVVPLASLDSTLQQAPGTVHAIAGGKAFLALGGTTTAAYQLLEFDLTAGTETIRTDAGDAGNIGAAGIERSHDHTVVVLNGGPGKFQRYDATSDTFGPRRSPPVNVTPVVDGAGTHFLIGRDLFDAALLFVRRLDAAIPGGIVPVALAPADNAYFATPRSGIVRTRVNDGRIADRTRIPFSPTKVRVSEDGTILVAIESYHAATSRIVTVDMR